MNIFSAFGLNARINDPLLTALILFSINYGQYSRIFFQYCHLLWSLINYHIMVLITIQRSWWDVCILYYKRIVYTVFIYDLCFLPFGPSYKPVSLFSIKLSIIFNSKSLILYYAHIIIIIIHVSLCFKHRNILFNNFYIKSTSLRLTKSRFMVGDLKYIYNIYPLKVTLIDEPVVVYSVRCHIFSKLI